MTSGRSAARSEVVRRDAGGARWEVATRAVRGPLAEHVREYVGYREAAAGPATRREVSSGRVVVIFDLGPTILVAGPGAAGARHRRGFAAGLHDRYALTTHDGAQEGIQLDLSPIGARLLFGVPLCELTNQVVGLEHLLPGEPDLIDALRDDASWDARFDRLDATLGARLAAPGLPLRVTAWAVAHIERARGAIDVRALSVDAGYSDKQLARLFREHVGVGPKRFARFVRLQHVLRAADARPHASWADLALAHGYCDQAHLARDVRDLTGLTPSEYRAERADVAELFGAP
ncbi:MAG: helix-turn-helix domain-containing protein [Myxococcota bacterium]